MSLRIPWNKYEVALLIDSCIRIQRGDAEKVDEMYQLSKKLRQMAISKKMEIDEIYRNVNGISWQMSIMEAILRSNHSSFSNHSKLFVEIANLYKSFPNEFEILLTEAKEISDNLECIESKNEIAWQENDKIRRDFEIRTIFAKYFVNGIRDGSKIELNKFRRLLKEEFNETFEENDALMDEINSLGFVSNGRIYVIDEIIGQQIYSLIQEYDKSGKKIIYFEDFYLTNKEFLNHCNIYAPEVLESWIRNKFPHFIFDTHYFSMEKGLKLENEILKAFAQGDVLTYEEIKRRLPYMDLNVIKRQLGISKYFLRVRNGEYMLLSDIYIDENILSEIKSKVELFIAEKGYASIARFDITSICNDNPYCTETAIRLAIAKKLDSEYTVQGDFVTQIGNSNSISNIFRDFCEAGTYLTEQEILDFEFEVTGRQHRRCLKIASENMIRISKNEFVSKDILKFNIDCVDESIERFMKYEIIGLKEVDSFVTFPTIEGYEWNSFLLESFCRLCSQRFSFMNLFVNSKCAGAIYRSEKHYENYTDLLLDVLVERGIKKDENIVNQYLIRRGFLARRINVCDILAKVSLLST